MFVVESESEPELDRELAGTGRVVFSKAALAGMSAVMLVEKGSAVTLVGRPARRFLYTHHA